ncbi:MULTISPECIES: hypothetical protein [unclassified Mycolicibacterium]|uniref:hypothetical protein n=1 Tax=unclassified Mycolicibacterium TaxID=2636767 RepID=UPI0012DD3A87|nr:MULTISPECIES: hypothetical protein [unclassified Mycolicibacterium]MUL84236.1 hypothetical protein [Mycolicibacterium sp. CBMA 329]MUL89698.1 hypothetical protein [Mycolicibacterium sp. CBMA 331]MUL99873.1 hypothetical protein [Mycolicibacterium sp. CBMA 334]MUM27027.1 hypothetical protein [Mycolicibacterium sp. CBMA 295]MUM39213.1 hypothetical protein [Mycolicibacterium sp. CBMA 247]
MTETPPSPDPATEPVAATAPAAAAPAPVAAPPAENKPSRLMQALAWVGIAAGIVFIVAVVFGTGFFLGAHSGGEGHHHRGGHDRGGMMMFHHGGPEGGPGPMQRGPSMMPPWGPGGFGPGGPGGPGSGPERLETPPTQAPPARP